MSRALAVLLLLLSPACKVPVADARPPASLTVVSWNIHHGRGADGVVDLDRIANVLRSLEADVIALQEVDVGVARTERLDIPTELGRRLGMTALFGQQPRLPRWSVRERHPHPERGARLAQPPLHDAARR